MRNLPPEPPWDGDCAAEGQQGPKRVREAGNEKAASVSAYSLPRFALCVNHYAGVGEKSAQFNALVWTSFGRPPYIPSTLQCFLRQQNDAESPGVTSVPHHPAS